MPSSERPSEGGILVFLLKPRKNREPIREPFRASARVYRVQTCGNFVNLRFSIDITLLCLYTRAFIYFPQTQLSGKNRDYASSGNDLEFQRIRQEDRVCRNYVGNVN